MKNLLKEKFFEFNIPEEVTKEFFFWYAYAEKGAFPEMSMDELPPSDDCFRTLKTYCDRVASDPQIFTVLRILKTPLSVLTEVKEKLSDIVGKEEAEKCFDMHDFYFAEPENIDAFVSYMEEKKVPLRDVNRIVGALGLGELAFVRVDEAFALLGDAAARQVVSVRSFFNKNSNPSGLIRYLKDKGLSDTEIAGLITGDPVTVLCYCERDRISDPVFHDTGYIDRAVEKYKKM